MHACWHTTNMVVIDKLIKYIILFFLSCVLTEMSFPWQSALQLLTSHASVSKGGIGIIATSGSASIAQVLALKCPEVITLPTDHFHCVPKSLVVDMATETCQTHFDLTKHHLLLPDIGWWSVDYQETKSIICRRKLSNSHVLLLLMCSWS